MEQRKEKGRLITLASDELRYLEREAEATVQGFGDIGIGHSERLTEGTRPDGTKLVVKDPPGDPQNSGSLSKSSDPRDGILTHLNGLVLALAAAVLVALASVWMLRRRRTTCGTQDRKDIS